MVDGLPLGKKEKTQVDKKGGGLHCVLCAVCCTIAKNKTSLSSFFNKIDQRTGDAKHAVLATELHRIYRELAKVDTAGDWAVLVKSPLELSKVRRAEKRREEERRGEKTLVVLCIHTLCVCCMYVVCCALFTVCFVLY